MAARNKKTLDEHDVSDLVGLNVVVSQAAHEVVDEAGDVSVEVDDLLTLAAAAAVTRCLMPMRLRGTELRNIRKIAGFTAVGLAEEMGEKTSPETVSRWENEKQPMGGYAEKVFRLVICERLRERAPGVGYRDGMIAALRQIDPWRVEPDYVVPTIMMQRVRVRNDQCDLIEAWIEEPKAAA